MTSLNISSTVAAFTSFGEREQYNSKSAHDVLKKTTTLLVPSQVIVASTTRSTRRSNNVIRKNKNHLHMIEKPKNDTVSSTHKTHAKMNSVDDIYNIHNQQQETHYSSSSSSRSITLSNTVVNLPKDVTMKPQSSSLSSSNSRNNDIPLSAKHRNHHRNPHQSGDLPDLEWRAIPMQHLRLHPYFQSLPLPHEISTLQTLEDVRYFRQGTWQWDALHKGRCTTSQLSAALGFLESKVGKALNIPKSLQHGSKGAYYRFSESPIKTLDDMRRVLLCKDGEGNDDDDFYYNYYYRPSFLQNVEQEQDIIATSTTNHHIWKKMNRKGYPFAAKYIPQTSQIQLQRKRLLARTKGRQYNNSVRMIWGSTQEATAILTAINYVSQIDPKVVVREVGMCGAGLQINQTSTSESLLVGASPDAIIQYSNGSLEALEVKNHCPFVVWTEQGQGRIPKNNSSRSNRTSLYQIRQFPIHPTIPAAYLPQMMMEILCLGPQCNSAMMVRQTATSGAVILRIYRDDEWIQEMLFWLNKFNQDYVLKKIEPPDNFFWDHPLESNRYREFIDKTKHKAENAELVAYINNNSIQRVTGESGHRFPLFLD